MVEVPTVIPVLIIAAPILAAWVWGTHKLWMRFVDPLLLRLMRVPPDVARKYRERHPW